MTTFGEWTKDLETLRELYRDAQPFEHVVIKDFFRDPDTIKIPKPDSSWFVYDNPFEGKYLKNVFSTKDDEKEVKAAIDALYSDECIEYVSKITGISNLEKDPYLNAGGLHAYARNGRSGIHLDYTIHPVTGKERRVSIMVYLSKNWNDEWGGKLRLWDKTLENETVIDHGMWNSAIIFRTNGDDAYHGFPDPLTCPEGVYRNVIGVYYMSDPTESTLQNPRERAYYFPRPGDQINEKMKRLYEIRKTRRLEDSDMDDWPTWREDCGLKMK